MSIDERPSHHAYLLVSRAQASGYSGNEVSPERSCRASRASGNFPGRFYRTVLDVKMCLCSWLVCGNTPPVLLQLVCLWLHFKEGKWLHSWFCGMVWPSRSIFVPGFTYSWHSPRLGVQIAGMAAEGTCCHPSMAFGWCCMLLVCES